MAKFRKKPVVIEATCYDWSAPRSKEQAQDAIADFMECNIVAEALGDGIEIETLEGTMLARKGDWIIKGVKGEFYPCKPDIFVATYEQVE